MINTTTTNELAALRKRNDENHRLRRTESAQQLGMLRAAAESARNKTISMPTFSAGEFSYIKPAAQVQAEAQAEQEALNRANNLEITKMTNENNLKISENQAKAQVSAAAAGKSKGGGTVICTYIHEHGYLDDETFALDVKYGDMLRVTDPEVVIGYQAWAIPLVEKLRANESLHRIFIKPLSFLTRSWAYEIADFYGVQKHPNKISMALGKFIIATGIPVCRMIGKFKMRNHSAIGKFA
jgi:hypothetical protein